MEAATNYTTVILDVGMHCESSVSEIIDFARNLRGVQTVAVNKDSKLTVIGKVDPLQILDNLRRKTKKKVDLVYPPPKSGGAASVDGEEDKNSDDGRQDVNKKVEKSNEKIPDIDKKTKEASVITIVELKLEHYCDGCSWKIRKIILDTKGVLEMAFGKDKEVVTVKGTMDVTRLMEDLKKRLNTPVAILSVNKAEHNNGNDSKNGSDDGKKKKGSGVDNGIDGAEMEGSLMESKLQKSLKTSVVFKMPLHCDGCIKRIRKIITRIRGVQQVTINKKEETVTVITTTDVKTLTETMKKRLKKLVEEGKIEIKKEAQVTEAKSEYSLIKQYHKQETSSPEPLRLSEQQAHINIQILSVQSIDEGTIQNQSPVSSGDVHIKVDSETVGSLPTNVRTRSTETFFDLEKRDWAFLIVSLVLEVVSAVLDQLNQLNYLFIIMVLAFIALLLCVFELIDIARREGIAKFKRSCLPCCYCPLIDSSPTNELFVIVHWFGLTSALWQCLYSTFQYICMVWHLHNPIRMNILPFLFLSCVLISKSIRKIEEMNCQNAERIRAETEPPADLNQSLNGEETEIEVPPDSSDPIDANVIAMEFRAGDYGNGSREDFYHCEKCGSCYPRSTDGGHRCLENAMPSKIN